MILDLREHGGEDFQLQILFVAQSVGAPLDDPDFIVQAFDEPQSHFVLWVTIGGNPLPVALNQLRKLFVGLQALPLQGRSPILKEAPGPAFGLVVPQLPEGLLEQVSDMQPLVSTKQLLEGPTAFEGKVRPMRQQRVLLPLDELALLASQPSVFTLAYLIQGLI